MKTTTWHSTKQAIHDENINVPQDTKKPRNDIPDFCPAGITSLAFFSGTDVLEAELAGLLLLTLTLINIK